MTDTDAPPPFVPYTLTGRLRTGEVILPAPIADHSGEWNDQGVAWDDDRYDFTGVDLFKPSLHTFAYTAADGTAVAIEVVRGMAGRFMPSVDVLTDEVPGQPGFRYRTARHIGRTLLLPAFVEGLLTDDGADRLADLVATLDPTKGVGAVQTYTVRNGYREITAVYTGGLEAASEVRPVGLIVPLTFECPDPYWHDRIEHAVVIQDNVVDIHTLRVTVDLDNSGDTLTWPVFATLSGNGSSLRVDSGAKHFEYVDPANSIVGLVIDTQPGRKTVMRGTSVVRYLTRSSVLWPLQPGANRVTFTVTGASSYTAIRVSWRNRYLTP